MRNTISARAEPNYYQNPDPRSVEQQLRGDLRSQADRELLEAIFSSQEWSSQSLPIHENFIRQLRHQIESESKLAYTCPFCSVIEKEANHMTEHIDTHFGLKRYACSVWCVANSFDFITSVDG